MRILGIHAFTHDSSAALVVDGRPVAFAQEERVSRIKGDASFPAGAIATCLSEAGLRPAEVDRVCVPFRPVVGALRRLAYLGRRPAGAAGRLADLAGKGFKVFGVDAPLRAMGILAPVSREDHYLSHARAVFCASPFERASVLVVDGVAEAWSGALYRATRAEVPRLEIMGHIPFPQSLGLAYAAVTEHLGYRHNREEGKVMAMAALGDPRFEEDFASACMADSGAVRIEQSLFDFGGRWTTPIFHRRFGLPRLPGGPFLPEHFALARAVQRAVEEACLTLARGLLASSGCPDLCFTGGLALNPSLNGFLVERSGCRAFFAIPAGGDPGAALGAALADGADPEWHLEHAFLGKGWSDAEMRSALDGAGGRILCEGQEADERAAEMVAGGAIGGLFRGRAEMGPRALGHRSIVADPRTLRSRDRLNGMIKRREDFQPFAPAVLGSACDRLFPGGRGSPYMLRTVVVPPEVREQIPAVVHADGTARVQSVEEGDASGLSGLLCALGRRTGLPVLLNTSLNRRGEPLADSPADAVAIFREAGLDFLLMGERLLVSRIGSPLDGSGDS
jgi:carbamoyltransferase